MMEGFYFVFFIKKLSHFNGSTEIFPWHEKFRRKSKCIYHKSKEQSVPINKLSSNNFQFAIVLEISSHLQAYKSIIFSVCNCSQILIASINFLLITNCVNIFYVPPHYPLQHCITSKTERSSPYVEAATAFCA